jgi:hypothetical protein
MSPTARRAPAPPRVAIPHGSTRPARRLAAAAVAATLLASCGSSGGSDAAKTEAKAPAKTTTTTTEVPLEKAGEEFQDLIEDADAAITDESDARDAFAQENDLEGAIDSTGDLKDALEDFRAGLEDLEVPEDVQATIDSVDETTEAYIEALEGYAEVTEISEYNEQLDLESGANEDWYGEVADAAEELEVDGLDTEGADTTSGSDDEGTSEGSSPDDSEGSSAGLITGDGSEYCLQEGDLPDGYLPLRGQDNMSNALGGSFGEPPASAYAENLEATWMVLPDGAAQDDDATASCVIYLFDSADSAAGYYEGLVDGYGEGSYPVPEEVEAPEGSPGQDPHTYVKRVGSNPRADQIFLHGNVVVSVGVRGVTTADPDVVAQAAAQLSEVVFDRLEAAG